MKDMNEKSLKSRISNEKVLKMKRGIITGLLSVVLAGVLTTIMPFKVTADSSNVYLCWDK